MTEIRTDDEIEARVEAHLKPRSYYKRRPAEEIDANFAAKQRPCACCGRTFRQTLKRRMLCANCYLYGENRG